MLVTDICRLCLAKDDLVWIFDKRFQSSENMKEVIYVTTGVEILMKDIISQKICKKCCQVTIKMFEFRRNSLKTDKQLREECKKYLKVNNIKIPNTDVFIKSDSKIKNEPKVNARIDSEVEVKTDSKIEEKSDPNVETKPTFAVHPSVRDLFKIFPRIKLPSVCLNSHVQPLVCLPMDQVENYFKDNKLDFNLYTKLALKSDIRKVATKKTSTQAKSTHTSTYATTKVASNTSTNKDGVIWPLRMKITTKNNVSKISEGVSKDANLSIQSKTQVDFDTSPYAVKTDSVIDPVKPHPKEVSKEVTLDGTLVSRKRKLSDSEGVLKKESLKKSLIDSLGLTPKANVSSSTSLTESPSVSYITNFSVPLHICPICNSVQYTAKDLRRHQNKHLRCQFCKLKFRTLETKTNHIQNTCMIKNTMNKLPDVQLDKIEYNVDMRRKYPEAFIDFPPLENMSDDKNNSRDIKNTEVINNETKPSIASTSPKIHQKSNTENIVEIIEIMSDDEDSSNNIKVKLSNLTDKTISKSILQQELTKTNSGDKPAPPDPSSSASTRMSLISDKFAPIPENIVYNTVSIVKPDIKIKNNNVLDNIDPKLSDVKILKELLTKYTSLQLSVDKYTHIELPNNQSICTKPSELTAELKNLKQQLHVYKIPVVIENGNFGINYNYPTEGKQPKQFWLWNDLKPVDVKPVNTRKDYLSHIKSPKNQVSVNNIATINCSVPSTTSCNFSGIQTLPPVTVAATRFVCMNTNSKISAFSGNLRPTTSIIDMNPQLNMILEPRVATPVTLTDPQLNTTFEPQISTSVTQTNPQLNMTLEPQISTSVAQTNPQLNTIFDPQISTSVNQTHPQLNAVFEPPISTPVAQTNPQLNMTLEPQISTSKTQTNRQLNMIFEPQISTSSNQANPQLSTIFEPQISASVAQTTPQLNMTLQPQISTSANQANPQLSTIFKPQISASVAQMNPQLNMTLKPQISTSKTQTNPQLSTIFEPQMSTSVAQTNPQLNMTLEPKISTSVNKTNPQLNMIFKPQMSTSVTQINPQLNMIFEPKIATVTQTNHQLNMILTPQISTSATHTVASALNTSTSHSDTLSSNTPIILGSIRVKNVWELT